jgi:flagellar basal-body rod modification protein FlgD
MTNLNLLNSNVSAAVANNAAWSSAVPSSIKTTAKAANDALTAKTGQSGMGQKDFLTLFTTQLKNQDPLDPVKNEAFVAQLAQFSQLEATTGMATSLSDFVTSQAGQQITSSSNLIGKKVSVVDGPAQLTAGKPVEGIVNLPTGADGVQFQVFDSKGILVNTQVLGAQTVGDLKWTWNGADDAGNALPDGVYSFKATAVSQGKTTTPSVSTMASVVGVSQSADKTVVLQILGGKTMKLADVNRIDG